MQGDSMSTVSAAVLLFLVMDPLGNVPLFLAALKNVPPHRVAKVILRECGLALAVLLAFLAVGRQVLALLGLTQPALGVAGGVVLLLVSLRMVFPSPEQSLQEPVAAEPFLVPLAIPYMAGPSSLAMVMLFMSREPARWPAWTAAVVLAWLAATPILVSATRLRRLLGDRGLLAVERLMGLMLVALSVQMLMTGVAEFLRTLPAGAGAGVAAVVPATGR